MNLPDSLSDLRVALVHDYLNQSGGAEKVLAALAEMFPAAPIYTSVYDADAMPDLWRRRDIRTSFMQRISPRVSIAKAFLPFYPPAFETFDLRAFDLVISNTTTFAKGVLTRPHTLHVSYCSNPTRFLWMFEEYLEHEERPAVVRRTLRWMSTPLRVWDYAAAQRVDHFVANSRNTALRIAKYYRRDSEVVPPPIDVGRFSPDGRVEDYFLVVSRLQSYKRIDIAVDACTRLGLPLHVVGEGPDRTRLQALAGPKVQFLGRVSDDEVRLQLARCKALVFPGEEDFGLVPLEAQACGRPVLAYAAGGALETVKEGETGMFFRQPTAESLADVLTKFDDRFDSSRLQAHARQFDKPVFEQRMGDLLARLYQEHRRRLEA